MHGVTITLHSAQVGTPAQQMASTERCKSAANSIYEIMEGDSKFAQCIKLLQDFQSYWSMTSQYLGILHLWYAYANF